jgi:UDP-N-acetylglucosamine transferase subunit ALG13
MGTIISALVRQKPIIIFPRIASLGEHRNEHQLATAEKMKALGYVYVAQNADELKDLILKKDLVPLHKIKDYASESLINELKSVIG